MRWCGPIGALFEVTQGQFGKSWCKNPYHTMGRLCNLPTWIMNSWSFHMVNYVVGKYVPVPWILIICDINIDIRYQHKHRGNFWEKFIIGKFFLVPWCQDHTKPKTSKQPLPKVFIWTPKTYRSKNTVHLRRTRVSRITSFILGCPWKLVTS